MKKILLLILAMIFATPITSFAGTTYDSLPIEYKTAVDGASDTYTKYVAASALNIRTAPSTDSEIVGTLKRGDIVDVIVSVGWWDCIVMNDEYYFVHNNYLSLNPEEYDKTDEDLWYLAHIINAEMGVESWEDKLYTGSVVLNRVNGDKWWGGTIRGVIFKKGQYSPTRNGSFWSEPNKESWDAANYLLTNGSVVPSNVVFQAEFKQGSGVWQHTKAAYYCYQ